MDEVHTVVLGVKCVEESEFNYLKWSEEMVAEALTVMDYKDELQIHRYIVSRTVHLISMTAKAKDGKVYYATSRLETEEEAKEHALDK